MAAWPERAPAVAPSIDTFTDAADHRTAPAARPRGRRAATGDRRRGSDCVTPMLKAFTVFKRAYDARKKTAIVLIYTVDCEVDDEAARAGAVRGRPARADRAGHPLPLRRPCAGRFRGAAAPAPVGRRLRALRHLRGTDPRADGPAADRARARQGGARAHQGHLGPVAPGRAGARSRTCSSARAAPAPSPTASSGARSATRATSRARCSPSSSRPARRRRSCGSASRTSAPSGWWAWSRRCAPRSRRWAARSASSSA